MTAQLLETFAARIWLEEGTEHEKEALLPWTDAAGQEARVVEIVRELNADAPMHQAVLLWNDME